MRLSKFTRTVRQSDWQKAELPPFPVGREAPTLHLGYPSCDGHSVGSRVKSLTVLTEALLAVSQLLAPRPPDVLYRLQRGRSLGKGHAGVGEVSGENVGKPGVELGTMASSRT